MASLRTDRADWIQWLKSFGAGKLYDALMATAQDAESRCVKCHGTIYLDIRQGGGVPDWRLADGNYGCGFGGNDHMPVRLER
jgi:hypothetical protein